MPQYDNMPPPFIIDAHTTADEFDLILQDIIKCNIKRFNPSRGWIEKFYAHLVKHTQVGKNIIMYYSDNLTIMSCV